MNRAVDAGTAVSDYHEFRPPSPLRKYGVCLWTETVTGSELEFEQHVLPDACVDIITIAIPLEENMMRRVWTLAAGLAAMSATWPLTYRATPDKPPHSDHSPELVNTCLITNDVEKLASFYEAVLGFKATRSGGDYAEFHTDRGVLAIFSAKAQEKYIPGSTKAASNEGIVLEFRVDDVDQEYLRLQGLVKTWVKPPTTQPWGTRSVYFRDPDGNLVDFFALAKAE